MKKHRWIASQRPLYKMEIPQNYVRVDVCVNCGCRKRAIKENWGLWRTWYAPKGATLYQKTKTPPCEPMLCVVEPDPILQLHDDGCRL